MKTMTRLLFFSFAVTICANSYAQTSVNDLFNTYVIVPAQQRIQVLTDELNQVNLQVLNVQDEIANTPVAPVEQGSEDADVTPPVSPFALQLSELQGKATELQNALSFWQTQLTLWLAFNTLQQEQYLLSNYAQIMPDMSQEEFNAVVTGANDRFGPMPDPNNPWIVPVFVTTGSAEQDALLINQWLIQHGVVKQD